MPCKFTVTTATQTADLTSPMDWWACQAAILQAMGIADAGPVASQAQAEAIAAASVKAYRAKQRASKPK